MMATLNEITTRILNKLEYESGSQEWWLDTEVKSDINDLYKTICKEGEFLKTRDTSVVSVTDQKDYDYPSAYSVITLLGVDYNNKPIHPTTLKELNAYSRTWRDRGSGTPIWYYFEDGQEFAGPSLFPKPGTDALIIAMRFSYQAATLEDLDEPEQLFKDGLTLGNGVLSIELAKEGEGQNIERSEYYWQQFISDLAFPAKKTKIPERIHVLRSVEDVGIGGFNLGEHYPLYRG